MVDERRYLKILYLKFAFIIPKRNIYTVIKSQTKVMLN